MSVSKGYLDFVLEQLECAGTVTARRMFGGVGLYIEGVFCALIADDVLFFKVDDENRADYDLAGMEPFRPFGKESYAMGYYRVPLDVLENTEELKAWAEKAFAVGIRKKPENKKSKTGKRK